MNILRLPQSRDMKLLETALNYGESGYPIYPVYPKGHRNDHSGKRPAIARWNELATCDLLTIEKWWGFTHVGFNIGLAIPAQLLTVDIDRHSDDKNGMAYLSGLEATNGPLPFTLTAYTGGDGEHRHFLRPAGSLDRNALAAYGIDLLTDGHGVILPPSESMFGHYRWLDPGAPIVALPAWFIALITKAPPKTIWQAPRRKITYQGSSPIDRFEERYSWAEVLALMIPDPWHPLKGNGNSDGDTWSHPHAQGRVSATIKHDRLFCFSTSTALPTSGPSDPHGLTRFTAWRLLNGLPMDEARREAARLTGGGF